MVCLKMLQFLFTNKVNLLTYVQVHIYLIQNMLRHLNLLQLQEHTGERMQTINSFKDYTEFLLKRRKNWMNILNFLKKLSLEIIESLVKNLIYFQCMKKDLDFRSSTQRVWCLEILWKNSGGKSMKKQVMMK